MTLNVKGKSYEFYGELEGPSVHLTISRISMIWDLYFRGSVGLGEAYIKKKFEADDLSKFLEFGALNERAFGNEMSGSKFYRFLSKKYMNKTKNSLFQSKKNIHAHYDLGNDFYLEWLDDTLTYSSGFFKTGLETLSEAQKNKFESLIEGNEPRPGDHVLEIGSGWGSFAFYLISKFPDIKIDTLTISKEQYEFVKTKIREHHLENKLNVIYKDYREHQGEYSRIYSIEMFEAVGIQYWQTYFEKIKETIKLADTFYNNSFRSIGEIPISCRFAILVARRVYRQIGNEIIKKRDFEDYKRSGKIFVTKLGKVKETFLSIYDFILLLFLKPNNHNLDFHHINIRREINLDDRF